METPDTPSVQPSEPEIEQRIIEAGIGKMADPSTPTIFNLESVLEFLEAFELTVDTDGFIIRLRSGDYAEPYAFDRDKFNNSEGPSENPFEEYFSPEAECDWPITDYKRLHLSDLHTVYKFGGKAHPVQDNKMNLSRALEATGLTFSNICSWSDSITLVGDETQTVRYSVPSETPLSLNCLDCGFRGEVTQWKNFEDQTVDSDPIRCPECDCRWDCSEVTVCTACQTQSRWEEITQDSDSESEEETYDPYWEPSCPNCSADMNYLHQRDRYSPLVDTEGSDLTTELQKEPEMTDMPPHLQEAHRFEEKIR